MIHYLRYRLQDQLNQHHRHQNPYLQFRFQEWLFLQHLHRQLPMIRQRQQYH
jgi:hypothetical protein